MTEKPLVSVITPCFKTERYLEVFLNHLPQQTIFERTQFVLDMNAPSDLELEILRNFRKSYPERLKVLCSKKVVNISTSMNRCVVNSDADTLAIWNVDDLRTEHSLENQYHTIRNHKSPAFTIDSFEVVNTFGQKSGRIVKHANLNKDELLSGMYLGPFFMFSKELIEVVGYFDEQLYSGADFDFAIRLARAVDPVYPTGVAGYYLDEGMGASTRANSLQPLERTVIELRYGIFHKIDENFIYPASRYVIPYIVNSGQFVSLSSLFRDYNEFVSGNLAQIEARNIEKFRHRIFRKILSVFQKFMGIRR